MYYVIQVIGRQEDKVVDQIRKKIPNDIAIDVFVPKRKQLKKYEGKWHEITERIFPSYVFVESNDPKELYKGLYEIPMFTKMLGRGKQDRDYFMALSEKEAKYIDLLVGKDSRVSELSNVNINEGQIVKVLTGPLEGLKGQVSSINLHKRQVTVLIELLGEKREVTLGINIVDPDDDTK